MGITNICELLRDDTAKDVWKKHTTHVLRFTTSSQHNCVVSLCKFVVHTQRLGQIQATAAQADGHCNRALSKRKIRTCAITSRIPKHSMIKRKSYESQKLLNESTGRISNRVGFG